MRRSVVALAFVSVFASAAGVLIGLPTASPARPEQAVFVVPANDGYDFGDCLTAGAACGKIVANSWCETQGYSRAVSFEVAAPEDVTGSILRVAARSRTPAVAITCAK